MEFSHIDRRGRARMVDIGSKKLQRRTASAQGKLFLSPRTCALIRDSKLPKGDPFEVARIAGIQAAKQTSRMIPLCHEIQLDFADVDIELEDDGWAIRSQVSCRWATGVEMEALSAVSAAALTLYDMCKAVDKDMVIGEIRLVSKRKEDLPHDAGSK